MSTGEPSDETVVSTAATAAEGVIFDQYKQSNVRDFDVTVTFEDGILDVDVYINVPEEVGPPAEGVAEKAAQTAGEAVDDLFESA